MLLRRVLAITAFLIAWGMAYTAMAPNAEASLSGKDALVTIGISAGIGTVLGLSTIAFYDAPTDHLRNALVGAGAGLIVGLGVTVYLLAQSAQEDEINPEELLPPENKPNAPAKKSGKESSKSNRQSFRSRPSAVLLAQSCLPSVPVTPPQRRLPSEWMLALPVLELRF